MKSNKVNPSMLSRLLVMLTAVISLAVLLMLLVFALSSRQAQIDNRVDALKVQAYDIAYLASASSPKGLESIFNFSGNAIKQMMERKLRSVYEDYSAYCLVVDRTGRVTTYFSQVINQHKELSSQFDAQDIARTLSRVLQGDEVILQSNGAYGPMFTVAVPWVQNEAVIGAVYIQTAAQNITSSYEEIWKQAIVAALFTFLVAAAVAVIYTRRLVIPLRNMASSAGLMAKGLPAPTVDDSGFLEIEELANSFNHMSSQIQSTEETRKAFIANLSHELRSPMTSIQGFVQGLLDETVKPENQKQTLQIVLDETKRLNHLVSGLLTLSRAEAPENELKKEAFNVCELIRLVLITRINQLEAKSIQVETRFETDEMFTLAAKHQIEQVLINLVDNAIRFTPQGGRITLSVQSMDKKTLAVTVTDNGIGITKEDAGRIFERFYKADHSHTKGEGVGLGLAICRAILEQHGQTIQLLPTNEGASFQFTLEKATDKHVKPHSS